MNAKTSRATPIPDLSTQAGDNDREIHLTLYVTGAAPNSTRARVNLDSALRDEVEFSRRYCVKVIDLLTDPKSAILGNVIVTPALVASELNRRWVLTGDLSESAKLRDFLNAVAE